VRGTGGALGTVRRRVGVEVCLYHNRR
jgi:hypothetical protein